MSAPGLSAAMCCCFFSSCRQVCIGFSLCYLHYDISFLSPPHRHTHAHTWLQSVLFLHFTCKPVVCVMPQLTASIGGLKMPWKKMQISTLMRDFARACSRVSKISVRTGLLRVCVGICACMCIRRKGNECKRVTEAGFLNDGSWQLPLKLLPHPYQIPVNGW